MHTFLKTLFSITRLRCPNCQRGKLFEKPFKPKPYCRHCHTVYQQEKLGDGPAYLTIAIVGHILILPVLLVERAHQPSMLLHMTIWIPAVLILSFIILHYCRAFFIAMQFHFQKDGDPPTDGIDD